MCSRASTTQICTRNRPLLHLQQISSKAFSLRLNRPPQVGLLSHSDKSLVRRAQQNCNIRYDRGEMPYIGEKASFTPVEFDDFGAHFSLSSANRRC